MIVNIAQLPVIFYKNKKYLAGAFDAACIKCENKIALKEIVSFTDNNETCLCPLCGHDTLVFDTSGFVLNKENIEKAHRILFTKT